MAKKFLFYFLLIIFKIIKSSPTCEEGLNFCSKCNPITRLCDKCEKDVYTPDEEGGCSYGRKCVFGKNYCIECNENENLCKKCEDYYYPDLNGGCSYTDNCGISDKGICLECINDFVLIGINENFTILNKKILLHIHSKKFYL